MHNEDGWAPIFNNFHQANSAIRAMIQFAEELSLEKNIQSLMKNQDSYYIQLEHLIYYSKIQKETAKDVISFLMNGTKSEREISFEAYCVRDDDQGKYVWKFHDNVDYEVIYQKIGHKLKTLDDLFESNKKTKATFQNLRNCTIQFLRNKLQNVNDPELYTRLIQTCIERSVEYEKLITSTENKLRTIPFAFRISEGYPIKKRKIPVHNEDKSNDDLELSKEEEINIIKRIRELPHEDDITDEYQLETWEKTIRLLNRWLKQSSHLLDRKFWKAIKKFIELRVQYGKRLNDDSQDFEDKFLNWIATIFENEEFKKLFWLIESHNYLIKKELDRDDITEAYRSILEKRLEDLQFMKDRALDREQKINFYLPQAIRKREK